MRKFVLLVFFLSQIPIYSSAQELESIKSDFVAPLDIPLRLSGTFGELRSNHFHMGLDIKTQGVEGVKVKSTAKGTLSRIKVSATGYGNTLYISHPNGYSSVYAHLKSFTPEVEALVRSKQYELKSFEVDFNVQDQNIQFGKGELIAYSGNTGGSGGPHLHFEIRETATEHPVNPLRLGFEIEDSRPPLINGPILIYNVESPDMFQTKSVKQTLKKISDTKFLLAEDTLKLKANRIAFGLRTFDVLNGAKNWNGVYSVQLKADEKVIFDFRMDELSFSESRTIRAFIDYEQQHRANKTYIKCFQEKNMANMAYEAVGSRGIVDLSDGKAHHIQIEVSDLAGNKANLEGWVKFDESGLEWESGEAFQQLLYADLPNVLDRGSFKMSLPFGCLFADIPFSASPVYNAEDKEEGYKVGDPAIPVKKGFEVCLHGGDIPEGDDEKSLLVLDENKPLGKRKWDDELLCGTSHAFGVISIAQDVEAPEIKPSKNYKSASNKGTRKFTFTCTDDLSGIKKYNAYLDEEWILMKCDKKKDRYTIELEGELPKGKHEVSVVIEDNVGNIKVYAYQISN